MSNSIRSKLSSEWIKAIQSLDIIPNPHHTMHPQLNMWHLRNGDEPLPTDSIQKARRDYRVEMANFKTAMWEDGLPQDDTMLATGTIPKRNLDTLLALGQRVIAHAFACYGILAVEEWKRCAELLEDGHRFNGLEACTKNTIRAFITMAQNIIFDSKIEKALEERILPAIRRGETINMENIERLGNNLGGFFPARSERYATFGLVLDALEKTGRLDELTFKPGVMKNLGTRRAAYYERKCQTY